MNLARLITLALLAVPLLACLIVLVREVYAFDVLQMRNVKVERS